MKDYKKRKIFLTAVICTYKRPSYLEKCICSILKNNFLNYEIIVVGQGDDEFSEQVIKNKFPNHPKVRYTHIEKIGLSYARNVGIKNAKGEVIIYIDDDAEASQNWLEGYCEIFNEIKPTPAMAGGPIVPVWEINKPEWFPKEREFLLGIYHIGDSICPYPEKDLPIGANFAIRRDIAEQYGGFDERVGFNESRKNSMIAGEDSLIALRVKGDGHSIYYHPKAMVTHHIGANKLKKKYFLKRHFWEGITHMVVEDCKGNKTKKWFRKGFSFHLKRIFLVLYKVLKFSFSRGKDRSQKVMLEFSRISYSMGICAKSFHILLKKKNKTTVYNETI